MDKIRKIKRLVESSLDTSFGGGIVVKEIQVIPTQMFSEIDGKWKPDSFAVFLTITDNRSDKPDFYHTLSDDPASQVTNLIESVLGFETCVAVM